MSVSKLSNEMIQQICLYMYLSEKLQKLYNFTTNILKAYFSA